MQELIDLFSLEAVGKSASVFNPGKLLWLNQHYIKEYPAEKLACELSHFLKKRGLNTSDKEYVEKVALDLRSRSKTIAEMVDSAAFYFKDEIEYEKEAAEKFLNREFEGHLKAVIERLALLQNYTKEGIEGLLQEIAGERATKLKFIIQPMRVALTGKTVSPGIDQVMMTMGKDMVIQRLKRALEYIRK